MDPSKDFSATPQLTPLEIMRQAFTDMEVAFLEDDGTISTALCLTTFDACVTCWGKPDDLVSIVVRLPFRAAPQHRAAVGEFLHRLDFNAKRKFWEIDHNDGEIRLSAYTDTLLGPLTDRIFRSMLHCLLMTAETVFPYLMGVLTGRMNPEFANDQAEAALAAMWSKDQSEKSDNWDGE